jgi:hypothetical protein
MVQPFFFESSPQLIRSPHGLPDLIGQGLHRRLTFEGDQAFVAIVAFIVLADRSAKPDRRLELVGRTAPDIQIVAPQDRRDAIGIVLLDRRPDTTPVKGPEAIEIALVIGRGLGLAEGRSDRFEENRLPI